MSEDKPPSEGDFEGEINYLSDNLIDMSDEADTDSDSDYELVDRRLKKRSLSLSPKNGSFSEKKRQKKDEHTVKISAVDPSVKLAQMNPVTLGRDLNRALPTLRGQLKSVSKCRDGGILVTASDEFQCHLLNNMTKIGQHEVKVTKPPQTMSGLQGVISGVPLDTPEADILSALGKYKVISAQRITKKMNGGDQKTFSVKLCFSGSELPEYVILGYCRYPVKIYVKPVIQCYKCRRFFHFANECRSKQRCARCGEEHATPECSANRDQFKCVNCGKAHSAAYAGCSAYKEAKEVSSVASVEKVPIAEAKRIVSNRLSFANAVSGERPPPPSMPTKTTMNNQPVHTEAKKIVNPKHSISDIKPKVSSVSTQTDFPETKHTDSCDLETYNNPSVEQLVLFFINSMTLLSSGSTLYSKLKMRDLAQTMLGVDIPTDKVMPANFENILGENNGAVTMNTAEIPTVHTQTTPVNISAPLDLSLSEASQQSPLEAISQDTFTQNTDQIPMPIPEPKMPSVDDHNYSKSSSPSRSVTRSRTNNPRSRSRSNQRTESPEFSDSKKEKRKPKKHGKHNK